MLLLKQEGDVPCRCLLLPVLYIVVFIISLRAYLFDSNITSIFNSQKYCLPSAPLIIKKKPTKNRIYNQLQHNRELLPSTRAYASTNRQEKVYLYRQSSIKSKSPRHVSEHRIYTLAAHPRHEP